MSKQIQYPVLTLVVLSFAAFTFLRIFTKPLEKPVVENSLGLSSEPFLRAGLQEPISWHSLGADSRALALRQQKPILLVIGSALSAAGQQFDAKVFTDDDVIRILARDFICVRADSDISASLGDIYLPYSRASLNLDPKLQIYVLDSGGSLLDNLGSFTVGFQPSASDFLENLYNSVQKFNANSTKLSVSPDSSPPTASLQANDLDAIHNFSSIQVNTVSTWNAIQNSLGPQTVGGFPQIQTQPLQPNAWNLLLQLGGSAYAQDSISPMLSSPVDDILHGGFFDGSRTITWDHPTFNKSSPLNAEMACVLAKIGIQNKNQGDLWIALRTSNYLMTSMQNSVKLIYTGVIGDEDLPHPRSLSHSISPSTLRNAFPDLSTRQWVRSKLGLRVETNPSMVPFPSDIADLASNSDKYLSALDLLQKSVTPEKSFTVDSLDANATVAARMMETGRILGNNDLILKATGLFSRLSRFQVGDDVVHLLVNSKYSLGGLNDYMSFSDACLQDYLTEGNIQWLHEGFQVFKRAEVIFGKKPVGTFVSTSPNQYTDSIQYLQSPPIADNRAESSLAKLVRLGFEYGSILQKSPLKSEQADAQNALQLAYEVSSRYYSVALSMGVSAAGFLSACDIQNQHTFCVASGPHSIELAATLDQELPQILVAPTSANVWPELQNKPGYYLIQEGTSVGPMTLDQIRSQYLSNN